MHPNTDEQRNQSATLIAEETVDSILSTVSLSINGLTSDFET